MMTKNEYIEKIIYLSSLCAQRPEDYGKINIKIHNKAARKLTKLEDDLASDIEMAKEVYGELIESDNNFIKKNAAALCLELKIHTDKAVKVFKYFKKHGERWEAMGAERQLKIWRGEIGPNDPF